MDFIKQKLCKVSKTTDYRTLENHLKITTRPSKSRGSFFTFSEPVNDANLYTYFGVFDMYSDKQIRQILEDFVHTACFEVGANPNDFQVKHMGLVNRGNEYKHGWYVQVQNFDDVYAVKRSNRDDYWRYTFRSVVFADETEPTLMVMKWIPSMGNIEDNENIHQSKYLKNDP